MDFDKSVPCVGFLCVIIVASTTIWKQRKLESAHVGSFVAAYLAGCNIPAAVFLCSYAVWPDPVEIGTKLHGWEKYVSMAGVALLFSAIIGVWTLLKKACEEAIPEVAKN